MTQSNVNVTLRNPLDFDDRLTYTIIPYDNPIAKDWIQALIEILREGNHLEKNFCFLGFPHTARNIEYLCKELRWAVDQINDNLDGYHIPEIFTPNTVRHGLDPDQALMNALHNHFEVLQGTVEELSPYYRRADHETKYAIRQLNLICHELESLMLSLRKLATMPDWVRSSQITTFINCQRYLLSDKHRELFLENGYDRRFGEVYMHWAQIGKTLFEVFRDEGAPELTDTVCEAITHLKYYSGEFDIEWGNDVGYAQGLEWHDREQDDFKVWLASNGLDANDTSLSLGYLPLGRVDLTAFGTDDPVKIREVLGRYLDIYEISVGDDVMRYNYCWSDSGHRQQQIETMKEGYDFSSRG